MRLSLRQRLIALTVLGTLAFLAALLTIVRLANTGEQQRLERATETVENEAERLRVNDDAMPYFRPPRARAMGDDPPVRSGIFDPTREARFGARFDRPGAQVIHDTIEALRTQADARDGVVSRSVPVRDGTLVVAVGRTAMGRYAWAALRVAGQSPLQPWRFGLIVLSVATLALVVATLQTMFAFRRGATTLQASLESLTRDLDARIDRPDIRELGDVADGITRLARALGNAQSERERLTRELAERERLASLGRVAAGVAHEVRNPLASMKLRVDLAERVPGVPASVAQDLVEVSGEIQRLDRLVTDLLAVAGRRLAARVPTELDVFAKKRITLLAPWANEHEVRLEIDGSAHAAIDPDALGRAIDNLMRNAIEFSSPGSVVRVVVSERDDMACIDVIDHGPGVPAANVSQLFEPFFTTRAEGTGLGLALSRSIATAHGGSLVYRRDNDETHFVLTVPKVAPPTNDGTDP